MTKDIQGRLCQDQVEEMDSQALLGSPDLLDHQATQMDKWNAGLDQLVIRVLLEFQGNQDCWVKLERKVKKERVALSVTWKDFVDPPGHRGPQEI